MNILNIGLAYTMYYGYYMSFVCEVSLLSVESEKSGK